MMENEKINFAEKDVFLPELIFIDQEEALSGAILPHETEPLTFRGEKITPLMPLNLILLDYFTPEDLIENIRFQPINDANRERVRVILDLPLAGMNDGKPPENYRLVKDYPLKAENALFGVPGYSRTILLCRNHFTSLI